MSCRLLLLLLSPCCLSTAPCLSFLHPLACLFLTFLPVFLHPLLSIYGPLPAFLDPLLSFMTLACLYSPLFASLLPLSRLSLYSPCLSFYNPFCLFTPPCLQYTYCTHLPVFLCYHVCLFCTPLPVFSTPFCLFFHNLACSFTAPCL